MSRAITGMRAAPHPRVKREARRVETQVWIDAIIVAGAAGFLAGVLLAVALLAGRRAQKSA